MGCHLAGGKVRGDARLAVREDDLDGLDADLAVRMEYKVPRELDGREGFFAVF
jgi:hypothetical protein